MPIIKIIKIIIRIMPFLLPLFDVSGVGIDTGCGAGGGVGCCVGGTNAEDGVSTG
jgi:hypothetical protein